MSSSSRSGSGTAGDGQPLPDQGGEVDGSGARQPETASAAAALVEALPGGVFSPSTPVDSRQDAPPAADAAAHAAEPAAVAPASSSSSSSGPRKPRIRIVPHIENARSLHFEVIDREFDEGQVVKVGRYTEKLASTDRIAFKSKVVSRQHAEMWMTNGQFYVKDTKSSSGTFLNHVRLSPPNQESRPFALKDGDVIQLGVDYQGGTEDIYRCVKMRLEVNRSWMAGNNAFRRNVLRTLRALRKQGGLSGKDSNNADCCICLCAIGPFQALFVAPCSHAFHYKCARQLLVNWPAFTCPLCRTFADLEASVSTDNLAEMFGDDLNLADDDEDDDGEAEGDGEGDGGKKGNGDSVEASPPADSSATEPARPCADGRTAVDGGTGT